MYQTKKIQEKELEYLELINLKNNSKARISLSEGGRLQELQFEGVSLIKDTLNSDYAKSYASSILFPFANRIKNGTYSFQNKTHQLYCNEKERNNALHGLVFDKRFILVNQNITSNFAEATFSYQEKQKSKGFPFLYKILLTYTLSKNSISLAIKVENTDTNSFPFTLGWHPYFTSSELHNSSLSFKSNQKIKFDEKLITDRIYKNQLNTPFQIKNTQLDDCYVLQESKVAFETPTYTVEINTDKEETYLQLYTPKNTQTIAIEPMTGISDSFNNKIGLQILHPNEEYKVKWNVLFNQNNK